MTRRTDLADVVSSSRFALPHFAAFKRHCSGAEVNIKSLQKGIARRRRIASFGEYKALGRSLWARFHRIGVRPDDFGTREDVRVTVLDAMTYAANSENVRGVAGDSRYKFVRGDICEPMAVREAIGSSAEAIVNFAAETHVDRSILAPEQFLKTDVLGTHILLEAVRERNIERFIQVSTDEVCGDIEYGSSAEDDPIRPRSPYAASKAGSDRQVLAYFTTFEVPILVTRGSSTYGPYQYPEKLIPLFVTNPIDDTPVPVYGDGRQT
jgi:dTDP-glucose 4,6-dehydratase